MRPSRVDPGAPALGQWSDVAASGRPGRPGRLPAGDRSTRCPTGGVGCAVGDRGHHRSLSGAGGLVALLPGHRHADRDAAARRAARCATVSDGAGADGVSGAGARGALQRGASSPRADHEDGQHAGAAAGGGSGVALSAPARRQPDAGPAAERATATGDCAGGQGAAAVVPPLPDVEPQFHPDSYGYRPQKSAIDALRTARQRCWRYDWVIDLDIRGFFDNLDHALVMRAVRKYTRCRWILLYVQRWLTAPMQQENGTLVRARSWPTSSCTSRSTTGCGQRTRTFRSRGTRMISSRTVGRRRRRSRSCRTSNVVWRNAGWRSIRRRRTSSTARMTTGRGSIPRSSSPSWGTRFARVGRRIGGVSTSSTSRRR